MWTVRPRSANAIASGRPTCPQPPTTTMSTGNAVCRSGAPKGKCRLVMRAARHLLLDPPIGLLEPVLERDRRLPAEPLADQRVVAVPAAHALRRREVVLTLELDAGDRLDDVDEAVDRHELRRAEIDRLAEPALHDPEEALDRVVDV